MQTQKSHIAMLRPEDVRFLVVHHSATPPHLDIGAKELRFWHMSKPLNWRDIGYHLVIRRDGLVEMGRPWHERGAHVRGFNSCSLGVCLVGGVNSELQPERNFTPEQYQSLLEQLNMWLAGHPKAEILGHRDMKNARTECPGFDVREFWRLGVE